MLPLEEAQFPGQGTRILQALWGQLKKKKKKSSKCDAHLCSRIVVHICYFILTTNWCLATTIGLNVKMIMQNEKKLDMKNPVSHDSIHMTFWKS